MSEINTDLVYEDAKLGEIDVEEIKRKFDVESRFRVSAGWQGKLVAIIAFAMSCFQF